MTTARDSLGAVSGPCKGNLSATCLYALGGSDAGSNALNPVEMYDPSSNAWTTLSSSLATPRFSMGAASGPCQRYTVAICLYAIGGMDANNNILSSVARFDPTTVSTVPIVQGWNLLDLPLMQSTPTTASSLVSYLDGASQLGAGSVRALATYASGRFSLYVSGYSSNLSLQSTQGIFLLNNKSGTWVPTGVSYPSGQQIALQSGWSLVAAPFPPSGLAGSVIASEVNPAGTVKEVAIFQGGSYQTFVPGQSTPFHVPSTLGFWIECANPATWTPS
jgi:hypothetical protein